MVVLNFLSVLFGCLVVPEFLVTNENTAKLAKGGSAIFSNFKFCSWYRLYFQTPIGNKKKSTEKRKTDFEEEKPSSKQKEIHRQTTVNVSENQIKSGRDHNKDNNALEINRNQEKGMSNFRYAYGIDSNSEIHEEDIKIVGDTSQEPIPSSNPKQKQKSFAFSEEKETSKTPAGFSDDFAAEYNKYADNVTVSDTFLKPPKESISKEKSEIDGKIKESTMSNNQTILVRVIELNK